MVDIEAHGCDDAARSPREELWKQRQLVRLGPGIDVAIPGLDDLIATKRFAARPKDAEDIRMLEVLRSERSA